MTSDKFKSFAPTLLPLVTAKPSPEIYDAVVSPQPVFSAPLTEVFRIKIPSDEKLEATRQRWNEYLAAIDKSHVSVKSLSGTSNNLEETTFFGAVGWNSPAVSVFNDLLSGAVAN